MDKYQTIFSENMVLVMHILRAMKSIVATDHNDTKYNRNFYFVLRNHSDNSFVVRISKVLSVSPPTLFRRCVLGCRWGCDLRVGWHLLLLGRRKLFVLNV